MSHVNDQKARFAMAVLHKTLKHFDSGGFVNTLGNMGSNGITGVGNVFGGGRAPEGGQVGGVTQNASNPNTGLMGTIGGLLGLNNNFAASAAKINPGTTPEQLDTAYTGAQGALARQNAFADAVAPGGNAAMGSQMQLLKALQDQSQGKGPNPAAAALAQNTAANTANQAALMAGQRGAGANAGLLARQASQQGAVNQQNAVGQTAVLQAQQQLAAQQALAQHQAQMVQQQQGAIQGANNAQQNEQNILQGANTAYNNAEVGMQSNINNVNAQTAAGNQNMNSNILGGIMGGASSVLGGLGMAEGGEIPDDDNGDWLNSSSTETSPSIPGTATNPANQTDLASSMGGGKKGGGGGGGGGMGSMLGMLALLAHGGPVKPCHMYAAGGIAPSLPVGGGMGMGGGTSSGPQSSAGQWLSSSASGAGPSVPATASNPANTVNFSQIGQKGGSPAPKNNAQMPKTLGSGAGSVGESLSPFARGGQIGKNIGKVSDLKGGGKVAGKPKVSGSKDSYSNDTQAAMLSPGEIVLPRSVTQSKDPVGNAAKFVAAIMAKKGLRAAA